MPYRKGVAVFVFVAVLGISSGARAVMDSSEKDASVRKMGVAWNIAEDRKVENIAGVYEAEGLDKYMKRYFDELSAKIDGLSMKVDKLLEQVAQIDSKTSALSAKKNESSAASQAKLV